MFVYKLRIVKTKQNMQPIDCDVQLTGTQSGGIVRGNVREEGNIRILVKDYKSLRSGYDLRHRG